MVTLPHFTLFLASLEKVARSRLLISFGYERIEEVNKFTRFVLRVSLSLPESEEKLEPQIPKNRRNFELE